MESERVLEIYKRSVRKYSIRHNPFNGNSDSSSCTSVVKERPYRAAFFVDKEKCVSHATKRMRSVLKVLIYQ